jgi:hypothetical protein
VTVCTCVCVCGMVKAVDCDAWMRRMEDYACGMDRASWARNGSREGEALARWRLLGGEWALEPSREPAVRHVYEVRRGLTGVGLGMKSPSTRARRLPGTYMMITTWTLKALAEMSTALNGVH